MKTMLITGGTVFVSKYAATYFSAQGYRVYVLNRNTRPQPDGTQLICADRHNLDNCLRKMHFDVVIDTAYTAMDVNTLLDALGSYGDYLLISSSAVYPDTVPQPFTAQTPVGENNFWGKYGWNKIGAEQALLARNPNAYILRPPYLYGPMNNLYREAFVFDCALQDRPFYLPGDGQMNLQFFHIDDLCRFMHILLQTHPNRHIFNVGNPDSINVRDWVSLCYAVAGKQATFFHVDAAIPQHEYFCFRPYEYHLNVAGQQVLMPHVRPLPQGLTEAFAWYCGHTEEVRKKPYLPYIDAILHPTG